MDLISWQRENWSYDTEFTSLHLGAILLVGLYKLEVTPFHKACLTVIVSEWRAEVFHSKWPTLPYGSGCIDILPFKIRQWYGHLAIATDTFFQFGKCYKNGSELLRLWIISCYFGVFQGIFIDLLLTWTYHTQFMAVIALENDKDLSFIDFQLFPGLEGTDPGNLKRHDSKYSRRCGYNFASGKLTTSHS